MTKEHQKTFILFRLIHSADTGNLLAMFHSRLRQEISQDREGEGNDSLDQGGTVLGVSFSSTETFPCRYISQSVCLSLYTKSRIQTLQVSNTLSDGFLLNHIVSQTCHTKVQKYFI